MRYNLACALSGYLKESEAALDLLGPYFANVTVINDIPHPKIDPDLAAIRDDPRFLAMLAAAEARLAAQARGSTAAPKVGRASLAPGRDADMPKV